MKHLMYLAGPMTSPNQADNASRAARMARKLEHLHSGLVLFVPHYLYWANLAAPRDYTYEEWMNYDFSVIEHCEGLLRMIGESPGADREVEFALSRGLPVFLQKLRGSAAFEGLKDWLGEK